MESARYEGAPMQCGYPLTARWILTSARSRVQQVFMYHACEVFAEPFILSPEFSLSVSGIEDPARLLIWVEDESGVVCARAYLDAAEVEAANRRGARAGEFVDVPRPGWKED